MKWILFLCCAGSLLAGSASLPTPRPNSATEPERYLFLIETSEGMRKLDQPSRQALFDLVYWGADGHMEGGDTYGLWTFNEEVQSGIFPMQVYDPDLQLPLATRASLFLKDQPYEKKTKTSLLVLKLLSVVISVKDVNIFIITDAEQPIVGLRFDQEIKAACDARRKEARRLKKPLVIALAARGGDIQNWWVQLPGEPVKLPLRRPAPAPPLIQTAQVVSNATPRVPVASITITAPRTNSFYSADRNTTAARTVSTTSTIEQPAVTKLDTNLTLVNWAPLEPLSASPAPPANDFKSAVPTPSTTLNAPLIAASERPASNPAPQVSALAPRPSLPRSPPPAAIATDELTVAAREPGAIPGTILPGATAPLGNPVLSATELIIAGVVLMMIAGALIFILLRRAHPAIHGSYITRSMDR